MQNLSLYYKYVIRPQYIIKFPQKKLNQILDFSIWKIRLNMFLIDAKVNFYLYLYNICILMRIIFAKPVYVKKIYKGYTLNKIVLQLCVGNNDIYNFLDTFSNIILPLFEYFNMGLKLDNFDKFGNYSFEFNYFDPIFTTKNTVLIWSINNIVKFTFFFRQKNILHNMLILRYLKFKYYFIKKSKTRFNDRKN